MRNKKLIYFASFVLLLCLFGSTRADLVPPPWISQDIGNPMPGSADYNPDDDSITITANGHGIWDNADSFHYVYYETSGCCDIIARVVNFTMGPLPWQKAGVMIRDDLTPGSAFVDLVVTGGDGGGGALQWRDSANGHCGSSEYPVPYVSPPEWVKLERSGYSFKGYFAEDVDGWPGTWRQQGTVHTTVMTDPVYIGFCVTSHSPDHLVTATFDRFDEYIGIPDPPEADRPNPADRATDVPLDVILRWWPGCFTESHDVYFGTNPAAPYVTTKPLGQEMYDPPSDLVASTTYYWQIVEFDGFDRYPSPVWEFTTVSGEAQCDYPPDGALITGDEITYLGEDYIWTKLVFTPGLTATKHTGYFNENYSKVESRAQDANLGVPPYAHMSGWEYTFFAGNPQVPPADDSLVRGTRYYWTVDAEDAVGNKFGGDIWEFTIQDFKAGCPNPPNEATFVSVTPLLSWCPGFGVEDHEIYMGTSWEDVNNPVYVFTNPPPEFVAMRSEPNYQVVDPLPYNTKIYWRVDQVQGRMPPFFIPTALYKGDVWCFTTIAEGVGSIRMDLWWDRPIILPYIYPYPPYPYEPFETKFLTSFNSGTQLADGYIGMIHGWLHPQKSGDYRFWICSDDDSDLYLSTDESPSNAKLIAKESAWTPPLTWNNDENMSDLIPLVGGRKYYINAVWREHGGGDHCMVAWQGPDQPLVPVDGQDFAIIPGNRLSPYAQKWAHSPYPVNGQVSVTSPVTLKWALGDYVDKHDVYIGTDKALVDARDASTYKGRFDPNFYGPVALATGRLFYWAIDEVNNLGPPPGIWKGPTWMFRASGAAGGLLGLYYHWDGLLPNEPLGPDNPFQVFVMSRLDPEINFNWGIGSPDTNVNVDDFAVKWIGRVECPVDANYTFYTQTDNGARLFINGVQILPDAAWQQQEPTEWSGSVILSAGMHDIEMQMYEHEDSASAYLLWSAVPTNPSDDAILKQIIPPIWLWPPFVASSPRPLDGSIIGDRKPALEWIPGFYAATHELYFSADYNDVNDRDPVVKEVLSDPCRPYPSVSRLQLGRTYYWCVDEVNSASERWNARSVWEFTISDCLSIDNMEDYNDRMDIRRVWRDGNADVVWGGTYPFLYLVRGGSSGSNLNVSTAVGSPVQGATGPIPLTPLNYQAMVLRYDNDGTTYTGLPYDEVWRYDAPYFSEIEANTVGPNSLDIGRDWESDGVKSLSLWFQGHPISDGDYDATEWPAYTLSGRGRDIGGRHDEFYFLSQYPFVGDGSVQVQVLRMDNTNPWAKAGVMIREKWTPYSKYAAIFITPSNGVVFQYRDVEDGPTTSITEPGVTVPQYMKLERTISGAFEAKHSANGFVWEDVNAPGSEPITIAIAMGEPNLYVGSAVTSHNANQICSADFNNMLIYPLPPNWIFGNIGTNSAEQLYVALNDGIHATVVNHPDPNAATLTDWQEWNIPLTDFTDINLNSIEKVYIGLGYRDEFVPGGSGTIYIDDIRACPPRCVPTLAKPLADIAQPYDCIVDEKDLGVLAGDWLMFDELVVTSVPSDVNLVARYQFEGNYLDSGVHANHLTDPCGANPGFGTGVIGSFALSLDGLDDHLVVDGVGISGTVPRTIACWAKADHTNIPDGTVIFGFTTVGGGNGSHFNIGCLDGGVGANVGGWEETIFSDEQALDWHHYAMSYDGTTIRYYGDGVGMDTEPAKSNDRILTHADRVHVGKGATQDIYFPGKVDEARIYSVQLSNQEIAYLGTNGEPMLHIPIPSDADLYKSESPGSKWINFRDYALLADKYLEEILWPTP